MGAGLFTFVSRDLNTVVEENRGQRAFEMADAGIQAAKRQLTSDCVGNTTCFDHYNDATPTGNDFQWSAAKDGLTLDDLDGDGVSGTPDSVNVAIKYRSDKSDYQVISTGFYGSAKRKIEAIFKGVVGSPGPGPDLGIPAYYTQSNIKIEPPISLSGISLFTKGDIIIGGLPTQAAFFQDMDSNPSATFGGATPTDSLADWCSTTACNTQAFSGVNRGDWNAVERKENPMYQGQNNPNKDLTKVGFAAVGKVCGVAVTDESTGDCDDLESIADGVYAYDCTTGPTPEDPLEAVCPDEEDSRGNHKTFVDKQPQAEVPQDPDTITFPFPRPKPKPDVLKRMSKQSAGCNPRTGTDPETNQTFTGCYYRATGNPSPAVWNELFPSSGGDGKRLVFIDAGGSNEQITFNMGSQSDYRGVLVVWCGDFVQQQNFDGIILNLYGDGSSFGASSCTEDKGVYTNPGQKLDEHEHWKSISMKGWLYAQGGNESRAGIQLGPHSEIDFSNKSWSSISEAFDFDSDTPPTSFELEGWRELYE
jgi:hypothetical protein